ncbi:MAG: hypothetical protein KGJ07_05270 [Patescibacteria group bacterium]|nr:hypothetical protein [Patescibacteria group bacterium]
MATGHERSNPAFGERRVNITPQANALYLLARTTPIVHALRGPLTPEAIANNHPVLRNSLGSKIGDPLTAIFNPHQLPIELSRVSRILTGQNPGEMSSDEAEKLFGDLLPLRVAIESVFIRLTEEYFDDMREYQTDVSQRTSLEALRAHPIETLMAFLNKPFDRGILGKITTELDGGLPVTTRYGSVFGETDRSVAHETVPDHVTTAYVRNRINAISEKTGIEYEYHFAIPALCEAIAKLDEGHPLKQMYTVMDNMIQFAFNRDLISGFGRNLTAPNNSIDVGKFIARGANTRADMAKALLAQIYATYGQTITPDEFREIFERSAAAIFFPIANGSFVELAAITSNMQSTDIDGLPVKTFPEGLVVRSDRDSKPYILVIDKNRQDQLTAAQREKIREDRRARGLPENELIPDVTVGCPIMTHGPGEERPNSTFIRRALGTMPSHPHTEHTE